MELDDSRPWAGIERAETLELLEEAADVPYEFSGPKEPQNWGHIPYPVIIPIRCMDHKTFLPRDSVLKALRVQGTQSQGI